MSFHGIPKRYLHAGDPYHCQCHATAREVAELLELGEGDWTLAFQSRVGREPWLRPYTDEILEAMPGRGIRAVDVICPGFAVDLLETLERCTHWPEFSAAAMQDEIASRPLVDERHRHLAAKR